MRIYFVSDLHLRSQYDSFGKKFLKFLEEIPQKNDTLVLGGDIFDLFVGDKKLFRKQFSAVIEGICAVEKRGCSVYYLEGNHDFHLKSLFRKSQKIFVMDRDFELKWGRKTFWIAHGDQIDKQDYGYRILRSATRSLWFRAFLKSVPDGFVSVVGAWSSRTSRKYNTIENLSPEKTERIKKLFRNYASEKIAEGYDFVFLGHSHQEDRVQIRFGERVGEYINLGFSNEKLFYAVYSNNGGSLEVKSYP